MFGKGVYLADMSSKSANYCHSYSSKGTGLLLLCEAELGDPMLELTDSDYHAGENAKKKGSIATWGKGVTAPLAWKDAGCVHPSLKGIKMVSFSSITFLTRPILSRNYHGGRETNVLKPDTTKAEPGPTNVPNAWLQYNEFICYDVAQIRLRYLLRVKM